jgi:hypothetical protein
MTGKDLLTDTAMGPLIAQLHVLLALITLEFLCAVLDILDVTNCMKGFFMCKALLANLVVGILLSSIAMGQTVDDPIGNILTGVSENAVATKNISFNYSVEYRFSEQWKSKELERLRKQLGEQGFSENEQFPRVPFIENTLRTGTFLREAKAFKISSKLVANADTKVFIDETIVSEGVKLTKVNNKSKSVVISQAEGYRNSDLSYFPDKFQLLFLDGRTIQEIFESGQSDFVYIGREQYDGTECEVFEISRSYKTPEGVNKFTKDRVWVAPQNDFLIKKGVSFQADPNKPINSIKAEFKEISSGLWYYSEITFESFPLGNIEPDVTMILTISDAKINQPVPKEMFVPDLTGIASVIDETQIK